ncbi:2-oxoisovalerate dehydrogenase E2 component (dihydrolipoyl transacylase) [Cupriavidus metallidurans]|jgi:2-oxoisovalerate dehydrogenase E2 component (dihydrolipoyl transacylase)|uniref:Dihydrolipoamide acetyltransferase component of pyruvate dehydrogenase complex n=1 Tax=Cupriavidus metallidurans TaxID=119219 RepID=A0A132HRV1_9BURK|nr:MULTISPECIES: dihydrolipoamide acetyltransferase family protein [Cupriavidus]AVA34839.1 2-oxo acid dehydrogenase subunit E2 [Cupriavidus metallidurans]KWR86148.1 branched-chain alpha-keto acid dehydrogenase subunit E2 [Cupriavidus sp. SHE]KWW39522.1 Dihydrolipoyllysine-residue acetyltransferase component of pyruvate dehydrogenase complex [Cupriavidus metallidurans]MDE4920739.1 dihydrolipoamide acetyltransferase family protein [Cupriavidus metallidurans]QBP12117.1 2-oxo acid dehydrogenase su
MRIFKLPDLGEGLQEAEIVNWHVKPGDTIAADQPLLSVETAKAIVEIPSPFAGQVAKLFAQPGDIVHLGAPLVGFEGAGAPDDAGTVVGAVKVGTHVVNEGVTRVGAAGIPGGHGIKATPAVRALARKLSVDLSMVTPSGHDGVITATDVQRVATTLADVGAPDVLRGVRRAMAQNMARAQSEVAAATVMDDADLHAWQATGASVTGQDITIRLVRALVAGVRAEPALNAWYEGRTGRRHLLERIDVGIAADLPEGLFVPVLRNVGKRDAADLRAGLDRMRADVVARTIAPEEMRGNTITLSNFGMIAGRYAAPIVVPPTVAILGAGRVRDEVVASGGVPAVHRVMPLSLTFDHRVVTGGEAARFLRAVIEDLERPE